MKEMAAEKGADVRGCKVPYLDRAFPKNCMLAILIECGNGWTPGTYQLTYIHTYIHTYINK
jgi:hypothetical protein